MNQIMSGNIAFLPFGEISDLQYFNKAITPSKIYSIYNSGYKKFNIGNLLYNLKSKINFSK